MNIGQASQRCGLSTKTIRYYEQIELVTPAKRTENGYRNYSENDLEQLCFLNRARQTGFTIDECRQLLALYKNQNRHSKHVKQMVLEKAQHVAKQIEEMEIMHQHLLDLAEHCQADEEPHCAIIDQLSEAPIAKEDAHERFKNR